MELLNRSNTKKYILQMAEALRPGWNCNRVSKDSMDKINAKVKNYIREEVERHPSIGKTFKI